MERLVDDRVRGVAEAVPLLDRELLPADHDRAASGIGPRERPAVLARLGPHHRVALTLRYLDGLSVPEVADHLGRGVHATEALLVRARVAFRRAYEGDGDDA